MQLDDIEVGMRVRYVPMHAHGDSTHKDCEVGIVTSKNQSFAFVDYGKGRGIATDQYDLERAE